MRFYVLVLLGTAVAACAATRPEAALPPQYAAAPPAPIPPAEVRFETVETGEPDADALLAGVAAAFAQHDWRALARTLDEADYAAQFAFIRASGRSPEAAVAQVLEETFGLGTVGNEVYPPVLEREARPFAGLERIRVLALDSAEAVGDEAWQVEGRVRLDDRTSRRLSFAVTRAGGAFRVVVPQG